MADFKLACEGVEIALIENDDGTFSSTIQAYPFGTYQHPRYGKLVMDKKTADEFAMNVNQGVTTTKLYIDFDHEDGPAAGWVASADVDGEGLNLSVDWTEKGVTAIQSSEYRYFSPYYAKKWKHPKTGIVHKNVMLGGGLVNRPFLRDINPVALGDHMDWKEFLKTSLGDDADKAVSLISEAINEEVDKKTTSLKSDIETDFNAKLDTQNQLIASLIQEKKKADIELNVNKWGKSLPVALHDPIKEVMLAADADTTKVFVKFMDELSKVGKLNPEGSGTDPITHSAVIETSDGNGMALSDAVSKLMAKDSSLSYTDAASKALANDRSLLLEYRNSAPVAG